MSDQQWSANYSSGTLSGWGDESSSPPAATAPAAAAKAAGPSPPFVLRATERQAADAMVEEGQQAVSQNRAEDLFADWYGEEAAQSPVPEVPESEAALGSGGKAEDPGGSDEAKRFAVMCPAGHALMPKGSTNDGWACDGRHEPAGCQSGITGFDQTSGIMCFHCDSCDYDLCEACYEKKAMEGIDDDVEIDVSKLQDLLRDNAAFFEACESAVMAAAGTSGQQVLDRQQQQFQQLHEAEQRLQQMRGQQGQNQPSQDQQQQQQLLLRNAQELKLAVNTICLRCEIEEVDDEEADDLFDDTMDVGVFYQFAREYFGTLCRTLTMAV